MECDFFMNGSIVALVTPFRNNEIDFDELDKLCQFHLENKTDGLLLLGTTAEAESLSDKEKQEVVKYVYDRVYLRIKLMIGLISNITEEVIRLASLFDGFDIDYYLVQSKRIFPLLPLIMASKPFSKS